MAESVDDVKFQNMLLLICMWLYEILCMVTTKSGSEDANSEEGDAEKPEKKKIKTLTESKNSSSEESLDGGDSSTKAVEIPSLSPQENDSDVKITDVANAGKGSSPLANTPKTPCTLKEQSMGTKTLFVGNLSFSVEKADVENFFQTAGEIVGIRFAMNSDSTFRGFGYVEFASAEAAEKALQELNGKELLRRPVRLDFARERESYTPHGSGDHTRSLQEGGRSRGQSIFIRGFNKHDAEEQIRSSLEEHFNSCGEIIRVSIPKDQDGGFKGIAYIDFKDTDAVKQALELNGSEIGGNALFVDEARPRGIFRGSACGGRGFGRWGGRSGGGWSFGGSGSGSGGGWNFGSRFGGSGGRCWNWGENNYFRR